MNNDIIILDEKKRNKDNLKPSELKILEEYIRNGGNATKAYATVKGMDISDQKEYRRCNVRAVQIMKKIKPSIQEELEVQGLSLKKISELIKEGITAYKINQQGEAIPDFKARHEYLVTLCKLRDLFPKPGIDINVTKQNNVLVVPGMLTNEEDWLNKLGKVREITDEMRIIDNEK